MNFLLWVNTDISQVSLSLSLSLRAITTSFPALPWSAMIPRNICVINVSHWRYFLNPSQSNSCAALSDVICVWTVLPGPRVTFISGSKNSWWVNILNLKPQQSWQVLSGTEKLYHPPHTSHLTPHQAGGHFISSMTSFWPDESLTAWQRQYKSI